MDTLEYWYPNSIQRIAMPIHIKALFDKIVQQINRISEWDDQEGATPFFFHLKKHLKIVS